MTITEEVAQDDPTFGPIPEHMHDMAAGIVKQALRMQLEAQDLVNQVGAYEQCLMAHVPERFDYKTRDPEEIRIHDAETTRWLDEGGVSLLYRFLESTAGTLMDLTGMLPDSLAEGALSELFADAGRFLSDD